MKRLKLMWQSTPKRERAWLLFVVVSLTVLLVLRPQIMTVFS